MSSIPTKLIDWQKKYGRHQLPWQKTRDPYTIWLSEIMLQQTQVNTVIPYYLRFIQTFPDINSLSQAPLDDVLALWSGLGYYSRARYLHQAARIISMDYQGQFPKLITLIQQLPGIGRSTAAAIAIFAYGKHCAILDGNVKRVFTRCFGIIGYPGERKTQDLLWQKAEELLLDHKTRNHIELYTQALMDLGAMVCTRHKPACKICPLQQHCIALKENLQDNLPTPKPRKSLPNKETIFLILMNQEKLLLEKRPTTGIWGGLWCLPEMQMGKNVRTHCTQHFQVTATSLMNLPTLNHCFTHFKLRIYPQVLTVTSQTQFKPDQAIWLPPEEALVKAIPTPVRTLLEQHLIVKHII